MDIDREQVIKNVDYINALKVLFEYHRDHVPGNSASILYHELEKVLNEIPMKNKIRNVNILKEKNHIINKRENVQSNTEQ